MRVRACSRDADCFIRAAWGPKNTACETFVCNENVMFPKILRPSPAIKAGAGYARPMQALSLASQALPDLRLRPSPLATKKAVPFDTA